MLPRTPKPRTMAIGFKIALPNQSLFRLNNVRSWRGQIYGLALNRESTHLEQILVQFQVMSK